MTTKPNRRMPLSADSLAKCDVDLEQDLRRRATMVMSHGVKSLDGLDIDHDTAACAIAVNGTVNTSVDVLPGTILFPNGEVVVVVATSLVGISIPAAETNSMVVRLQYGEVATGQVGTHPIYNEVMYPLISTKPLSDMVVVETVASYLAQPISVKGNSVVLGVCRYDTDELTVDNTRTTYGFNRPRCSVVDDEHRNQVGSATVTPQNPHGQQFSDFGVGAFTAVNVLVGGPSVVVAKPSAYSRLPGSVCVDNIPAGAFVVDVTGRVTGVAGARYAPLGSYPHTLLRITTAAGAEVAGWVPVGRNVVAIVDPVRFATAVPVVVTYTTVQAGALPGVISGSALEVLQPTEDEVLIADGGTLLTISEPRVVFSEAGVVPMAFDLWLGSDGKVFKRPDVLLCATRLDTLGAGIFVMSAQPRAPTKLRLAISQYQPDLTQIQVQVTGTNAAGATINEVVTFAGPLPAAAPSFTEVTAQRLFTTQVFATITQAQILSRLGDGPSTTLTVFAEHAPEVGAGNPLFLGTVHWTGAGITNQYVNGSSIALDRRPVVTGGQAPSAGIGAAIAGSLLQINNFGGSDLSIGQYATVVEEFSHPSYSDALGGPTLPNNSLSIPHGYQSRIIPLGTQFAVNRMRMIMVPLSTRGVFSGGDHLVKLEFLKANGTIATYTGTTSGSPWGPHIVRFTGPVPASLSAYAVRVTITAQDGAGSLPDVWGGFVLHINDGPA
jgi:hypothetical protein